MIKGIFITGTDTGVGKTYAAAGIARELTSRGIDVGVMKPVESGCGMRSGSLVPRDAMALIKAAGVADSLTLVNPYRFRRPLAPSVAAGLEHTTIRPVTILSSFQKLSSRHRFMIVEGAGGILVPLCRHYTYLDLAGSLGLPVVVVARPSLGTINHTLLTIAAIKGRGLSVAGIIINYARKQRRGEAEKTSPQVIEELSGVNILCTVPYGSCRFSTLADCLLD